MRSPDAQEVVLHHGDGTILEGLSSNFFVLRNGVVYTAPDEQVVCGTVRKVG